MNSNDPNPNKHKTREGEKERSSALTALTARVDDANSSQLTSPSVVSEINEQ